MPEVRAIWEFERAPEQELPIYRLARPASDRETIQRVAKRFGLKGEMQRGTFCEGPSSHAYTEADWTVNMFRESGGWKYRNHHRWQVDDGTTDFSIEDDEAISEARRVVERYEVAPVEDFRPLRVTRLRVATSEREGRTSDERVIDVGVAFRRLVRGVPVEGPGGQVVVYLDGKRELTGVDRIWREIEGEQQSAGRLRTAEEALEEVRRRYQGPGAGRVEVTSLRFGYFEMGWHHEQEFLQPAYVAFLRLVSRDERIRMNSVFVMPAGENHVGEIEPSPPRLAAQPRREAAQT
jgi:hypothetical protein